MKNINVDTTTALKIYSEKCTRITEDVEICIFGHINFVFLFEKYISDDKV
jgi:hypothetical protein